MNSDIEIKQDEEGKMCAYYSNGNKLATLKYDDSWHCWRMIELHGNPSGAWLVDLGQHMQKLDKISHE
jgi:hypothetical protein